MSPATLAVDGPLQPDHPGHSRRAMGMLCLAATFFLMSTAVGLGWDRRWHASHVFNSFYSPPHIFIYATLALALLTVAAIMLWPATRSEFGAATVHLPGVNRAVPGVLSVCAAGLGVVLLAGLVDDIWHTNFGLDETAWSFPHAMLGTGFQLVFMGLLACRLALSRRRPVGAIGWAVMGTLLLFFSIERISGPLLQPSPDMVRGVAAFPVLAVQPAFQHTARIYQQWNLNRGNWLFVPAAALATGIALGLVWSFGRRRWVLLVAAAIFVLVSLPTAFGTARYFGLQQDARNWLPVPVLPAAVGFVIARSLGVGEWLSWLAAGALFGVATLVWDPHPLLIGVAAIAMVVGAGLGRRMWWIARHPTGLSVAGLALLFGIGIPALTGAVDLYLRLRTP